MPLRIPTYQQQTTIDMVGQPRASQPVMQSNGIGQALAEIGQDLGRQSQEMYKAQKEADLSDRLGRATADLADLELTFERDQEFRTAGDRFKTGADAIRDRYIKDVTDPAVRVAFTKRFGELSLAKSLNVRRDAFKKERDYNDASLTTGLEVYSRTAATAGSPEERAVIDNQALLSISSMQSAGWITAEDAAKRERDYFSKVDEATVIRDLSIDPNMVVAKLGIDPSYAARIDPVRRERYIDQGIRRGAEQRRQAETTAERDRKRRGDDAAKDIWGKLADKSLTRDYLDSQRHLLEPGEYRSMLEGLNKPDATKDDAGLIVQIESVLYTNPGEARRLVFQGARTGALKGETLRLYNDRVRDLQREEGPRSPYERERAFITNAIKPSDMVQDPAASARFAMAMREFDDFASGGRRTEAEMRTKADEIIKRRSMVDMVDLARQTGIAARGTPADTVAAIDAQIVKLNDDFQNKKITRDQLAASVKKLNAQREAAEKANAR